MRAAIWRHTSTIGGHGIDVKLAHDRGEVVNAQPEWDDVARAAAALGRPVKDVLAEAVAATRALLRDREGGARA